MPKLSLQDLETLRNQASNKKSSIAVGMSACGLAAGAEDIFQTLTEEVKKRDLAVEVTKSGCAGMCYAEPMVEIKMEGLPTVIYGKVNREDALEIVERHIMGKSLLNDHIFEVRG